MLWLHWSRKGKERISNDGFNFGSSTVIHLKTFIWQHSEHPGASRHCPCTPCVTASFTLQICCCQVREPGSAPQGELQRLCRRQHDSRRTAPSGGRASGTAPSGPPASGTAPSGRHLTSVLKTCARGKLPADSAPSILGSRYLRAEAEGRRIIAQWKSGEVA
ncbi:uncharacterized protein LOC143665722 [Tamandua tetradactyla]|uniref:uncharacterized protein LOC143665722 n=1 Tax=Tamandua tetradactyla TaxID=48850 RepID=UPI004054590A